MELPKKSDIRESQRFFDELAELAAEVSNKYQSIHDEVEENEGILQETEERLSEVKRIEDEIGNESIRLETLKLELHAQKIRYDGLMIRAEERLSLLNRKPLEWMEEIIMALECDESPAEILRRFRQTQEIIAGSWA